MVIYRFEQNFDGRVIAETRNEELPSIFDIRFPASDIPPQARQLYKLNRVRIIPNADYQPVPLEASIAGQPPLDLSFSVLRSVSPVHLEYMRNMGTMASMSISILREGELWGLISCHSRLPHRVSFPVRNACDILSQIFSSQSAAAEHRESAELRIQLKSIQTQLLGYMAEAHTFIDGLKSHPEELLACTGASGAAILFNGECSCFGIAPTVQEVLELAAWLRENISPETIVQSSSLASIYPPAASFSATASGLIAVPISSLHKSYVMWFRPELQGTVNWAGDPNKYLQETTEGLRIGPRKSFDTWKQTVHLQAQPWLAGEVESARELREAIVRIVLRKAEELAQVSENLRLSNQELEAFSYSVSHDLRAPFRHIVGYGELLRERESSGLSVSGKRYVDTIIESAQFAGSLVDNLLSFSQIGRASLHFTGVDTERLVREVIAGFEQESRGREIEWHVQNLPQVRADLFMLRLVFQNLLSNALKYSASRSPAIIHIGWQRNPGEVVFWIRDNGVGFDPQYSGKLFGVFQRLHKMEDFAGTGIGLANVRRIVTRHGGRTWAEGEVDRGATIYFSLPDAQLDAGTAI